MSRKALFGLLIALLVPVLGYVFMKQYSREVQMMPRHYIFDTVVQNTVDGKDVYDTVWHTIPDFSLTNHLGDQVGMKDLQNKVIVANFFFTRCPTICPRMTMAMKTMRDDIKSSAKVGTREANFVQFLSFSVDPERDSVHNLKNYADRFGINPQNWWLLTGEKKQIYDLANEHMKLGVVTAGQVDTNFIHSDMFVLIDKKRNIRGYYHSLKEDGMTMDTASLAKLSRDLIFLSLEKDANKKSPFAGKLELIAIVFGALIIGLILLFIFLKREKSS
jgi:protein SCO1/2